MSNQSVTPEVKKKKRQFSYSSIFVNRTVNSGWVSLQLTFGVGGSINNMHRRYCNRRIL